MGHLAWRRALAVIATAGLLACAGSGRNAAWVKPGAGPEALAADRQVCLQEALSGGPNPTDPAAGEYDPETFRQCMQRRGWSQAPSGGD